MRSFANEINSIKLAFLKLKKVIGDTDIEYENRLNNQFTANQETMNKNYTNKIIWDKTIFTISYLLIFTHYTLINISSYVVTWTRGYQKCLLRRPI